MHAGLGPERSEGLVGAAPGVPAAEKPGAHAIASAKAGKLSSTLFEPVDAVSVPVHTNGSTLNIGGDDDDVDVPPFMRR